MHGFLQKVSSLVFCLALSCPASAEAPVPAPAQEICIGQDMYASAKTSDPALYESVSAAAKKTENTEAIFWKVEKTGVAPSYLFGTIHITDPRVTAMPAKAKAALDAAKTVALEFVGGEDAAAKSVMESAGDLLIYTDGRTLNAQLTPDEFERVKKLVEKYGLPGDAATLIRPWFVTMLLSVSECEKKKIASGALALDGRIEMDAKARGAELAGLETPASQLAAITSVPEDQQIQMLKAGLAYADRTNDTLETLIQMYLHRDIGAAMPFNIALAAKAGIPASAFDDFVRILLTERNAKMREGAVPLIEKGGAFIAVGAMHLVGPNGLVKLLRDQGYTVTADE